MATTPLGESSRQREDMLQGSDRKRVEGAGKGEQALRRNPPPDIKSKIWFMEQGCRGSGVKPDRIRISKQVSLEECETLFGPPVGDRKKFNYRACQNSKVLSRIEKLWPLLHSKKETPSNGLLSLEFIMGVVAETKSINVDWAAFGEQQNKKQRSSGFVRLSLGKSVGVDAAVSNDVVHRSVLRAPGMHLFSDDWMQKLRSEISDFLNLVALELWSSKQVVQLARSDSTDLLSKIRVEMAVKESMDAKADLKLVEIQALQSKDLQVSLNPSGSGLPPEDLSAATTGGKDLDTSSQSLWLVDSSALILESDELLECRRIEKCYRDLALASDVLIKKLGAEVEIKQRVLKEAENRQEFHELFHQTLQMEQSAVTNGTVRRTTTMPHPIPYPPRASTDDGFALKVSSCAKCNTGFPFKDVILSQCKHAYHPWCASIHFRTSNHCAYEFCKAMATPKWYKSFGFLEFNSQMLEKEKAEGCEELRIQALNQRREAALSKCPDVEKSPEFQSFLTTLLGEKESNFMKPPMGTITGSVGDTCLLFGSTKTQDTEGYDMGSSKKPLQSSIASLLLSGTNMLPLVDKKQIITLTDDDISDGMHFSPLRVKIEGQEQEHVSDDCLVTGGTNYNSADSDESTPPRPGVIKIDPPLASEASEDSDFQKEDKIPPRRCSKKTLKEVHLSGSPSAINGGSRPNTQNQTKANVSTKSPASEAKLLTPKSSKSRKETVVKSGNEEVAVIVKRKPGRPAKIRKTA